MSKFKKIDLNVSAEVLAEVTTAEKKERKDIPLEVGSHEVIVEIVIPGKPCGDSNWQTYNIKLVGSGRKSAWYRLSIPVGGSILYSGKTWAIKKFLSFLSGIMQRDVPMEEMNHLLERFFGNPACLKGMHLGVVVGFDGPHAVKLLTGPWKLVDKNGKDICSDDFNSPEAAGMHAEQAGISYFALTAPVRWVNKSVTSNKELINKALKAGVVKASDMTEDDDF